MQECGMIIYIFFFNNKTQVERRKKGGQSGSRETSRETIVAVQGDR